MDDPRVSVVLPVYNGEPYVRQALDSLLAQTFGAFEILVVDDGSDDATNAIVSQVASTDPRVRLLHQQHAGAVTAFNLGASRARGEYLAWLGADDVALPTRFERQIALLDTRREVAVIGSDVLATDEALRPLLVLHYPSDDRRIRRGLRASNLVAAPSAIMRTAVYEAVGGCRPAFAMGAEDYDLWLRIAEHHALLNLPEVLVHYRVHRAQVSRTRRHAMVLSTVAAQLAADQRRMGNGDDLEQRSAITYETLLALNPDRRVVNTAVLYAAAGLGLFLVMVGAHDDATELLDWAATIERTARADRGARAKGSLVRGMIAWKSRHTQRALGAAALALLLSPLPTAGLLLRGGYASARLLGYRLAQPLH